MMFLPLCSPPREIRQVTPVPGGAPEPISHSVISNHVFPWFKRLMTMPLLWPTIRPIYLHYFMISSPIGLQMMEYGAIFLEAFPFRWIEQEPEKPRKLLRHPFFP